MFKIDIAVLYHQTPSVSSVALSAFIKNHTVCLIMSLCFSTCCTATFLGEKRGLPTDVKRKADTESG